MNVNSTSISNVQYFVRFSVETVENDTKTWKRKLCLETNKKQTHIRSNFFQLFWNFNSNSCLKREEQAFIHDLSFNDIFIVFHTCINFPFWCLLMVNCRFYILVRGFRRVYKRRGLHPRELITGIENASKQSTEVLVKIILHLLVLTKRQKVIINRIHFNAFGGWGL